jgi:hypothetical protein
VTPDSAAMAGAVSSAASRTYGPAWIILAALVGALGGLAAQFVANRLTRGRELTRFRIDSFERFRSELWEDADLKVIRRNHTKEPLTNEQKQDYLGFWEEVGIYDSKGIVDEELLDEILGDYILDCYNDSEIRKYIAEIRVAERDDTYYEFFERLARKLIQKRSARVNK